MQYYCSNEKTENLGREGNKNRMFFVTSESDLVGVHGGARELVSKSPPFLLVVHREKW